MNDIRQGDVIHYEAAGIGGNFNGELFLIAITNKDYIGIDKNSKYHTFKRNNPLATVMQTGLHFNNQNAYLEYLKNESGDMTLEELLSYKKPQRARNFRTPDVDVRLTLVNSKDEKRQGQLSLLVYRPHEGFNKEGRFDAFYVIKNKHKRLYIKEDADGTYKVQNKSRYSRIPLTNHELYKEIQSAGCKSLSRNWKLDTTCNVFYISIEEA